MYNIILLYYSYSYLSITKEIKAFRIVYFLFSWFSSNLRNIWIYWMKIVKQWIRFGINNVNISFFLPFNLRNVLIFRMKIDKQWQCFVNIKISIFLSSVFFEDNVRNSWIRGISIDKTWSLFFLNIDVRLYSFQFFDLNCLQCVFLYCNPKKLLFYEYVIIIIKIFFETLINFHTFVACDNFFFFLKRSSSVEMSVAAEGAFFRAVIRGRFFVADNSFFCCCCCCFVCFVDQNFKFWLFEILSFSKADLFSMTYNSKIIDFRKISPKE